MDIPLPLKQNLYGLYVDFESIRWLIPTESRREYLQKLNEQGFAEALPVPYERTNQGLIVIQDIPECGFERSYGLLIPECWKLPC